MLPRVIISKYIPEDGGSNDWKKVTADDVCEYIQRGKQTEYSEDGEVNIINQRCIYWDGLLLSNSRTLSENQRPKWQDYRYLQAGDVVLNSTGVGTVGRAQIFPGNDEPYVVDGHVTVMRPSKQIRPEFLWYFLWSEGGQKQIDATGSTGQIELRKKDVLNLDVPLPPLDEQDEIIKKLESYQRQINNIQSACDERHEVVDKLSRSILNKAFKGQMTHSTYNKSLEKKPEQRKLEQFKSS